MFDLGVSASVPFCQKPAGCTAEVSGTIGLGTSGRPAGVPALPGLGASQGRQECRRSQVCFYSQGM